MGEVAKDQYFRSETTLLPHSDAILKPRLSPLAIQIDPPTSQVHLSPSESDPSPLDQHQHQHQHQHQQNQHPKDAWLPITESRNGNAYYAAFHILNSNIGFQALMLPVAFSALGWAWGTVCLSVAFVWQLYTLFLLVRLHESVPGIRHSRYLFLAMAAFGPRLGKVAALFPVMYLSGGSCVMFIITGGGTMKLLFNTLCDHGHKCDSHSLSDVEWFLIFTCVAILIAQLPSLNSMSAVSLIGAVTAISYCTLFWVLSVKKGRPPGVSYSSSLPEESTVVNKISDILNAIGMILLAFRGHNLLLEIQGTLPSNFKETSKEPMRRGVSISYVLVAMCLFPVGIAGFWAYGNQIPHEGLLTAFPKFHRQQVTKFSMGAMYLLIIIHCLTSYQIYAMPVFDNLEIRYTSIKNQRCPRLVRTCLRLFFGGLTFFIAVTFPFLPSLAAVIGGMTLVPVTYAYPCFMWLAIKKPRARGAVWCFNVALGCVGMLLGAILVVVAVRTLAVRGLNANFFTP